MPYFRPFFQPQTKLIIKETRRSCSHLRGYCKCTHLHTEKKTHWNQTENLICVQCEQRIEDYA